MSEPMRRCGRCECPSTGDSALPTEMEEALIAEVEELRAEVESLTRSVQVLQFVLHAQQAHEAMVDTIREHYRADL